jgi:1-acyl-sn-glycerol-3-phosphate acyltransferase
MKTRFALWRRFLYWFITRVYFARITVLHPDRLPQRGPVLYLGLHRNGAVDGFVYHQALQGPTFMISTQLLRNWFARLFFTGIAVTRTKDEGDRAGNNQALQGCLEHLQKGGALFVFPEGTSSLGPRHLPFKSGALWLILEYLETPAPPLQVIPVGIHYECPWAFRAKVEVVIGQPLELSLLPDGKGGAEKSEPAEFGLSRGALSPGPEATYAKEGAVSQVPKSITLSRLKGLKRCAQSGLEEVGINVVGDEYQKNIQRLAYVSTLATPRSYFSSLKALEKQIPEPILRAAAGMDSTLQRGRLLLHQGVPLVPMGPVLFYVFALLILSPVVLAAMLLNAPPLLAGFLAGKKFPDDVNVISLWKVLVGIPTFLIWMSAVCITCILMGKPVWLLVYAGLTWAGLHLYYRVKKLAVAVHNGLRYSHLIPTMLQFRETVLSNLPRDTVIDES